MSAYVLDSDAAKALAKLSESIELRFPIETKDDFRAQLLAYGPTVEFAGRCYDTAFGASLIPAFFFPLADRDDLVFKVGELLVARGMSGSMSTGSARDGN